MTTLDEISSSKDANYRFWTDNAKLCLACYRSTGCKLEKAGFRKNLWHRRNMTYYNPDMRAMPFPMV